jgi:hypothetical protein
MFLALRILRITVSCSSVKGTFHRPRSRGSSMKRGLVRAAYRPGKSNAVTHPLSLMTRALRRNVP